MKEMGIELGREEGYYTREVEFSYDPQIPIGDTPVTVIERYREKDDVFREMTLRELSRTIPASAQEVKRQLRRLKAGIEPDCEIRSGEDLEEKVED